MLHAAWDSAADGKKTAATLFLLGPDQRVAPFYSPFSLGSSILFRLLQHNPCFFTYLFLSVPPFFPPFLGDKRSLGLPYAALLSLSLYFEPVQWSLRYDRYTMAVSLVPCPRSIHFLSALLLYRSLPVCLINLVPYAPTQEYSYMYDIQHFPFPYSCPFSCSFYFSVLPVHTFSYEYVFSDSFKMCF
jgi:hypothetical protein